MLPGGALPDFLVWPVLLVLPLMCLVAAWTTPPLATPDELKSATSQVLLTALLLVLFWRQRAQPKTVLTFSPTVLAFAALFLLGTLSVLWAANPAFWFYKWSRWYAGFVMFLFGLQLRQNTVNLDRFITACLAAGVITAVVGSAQQLFGFSLIPQTAFPASTFGNGNVAGEVMIYTAPLGLYFLFKPDLSRRTTWLTAAAMCLIGMYTFYTRTRAVWLAVILEIVLVTVVVLFDPKRSTWFNWNRQKTWACTTFFVVFMTMLNFGPTGYRPFWQVAAFEFTSIAPEIAKSQGQGASARYLIWRSTLEMIKDSPVAGTGVGSFFEVNNNGGYNNVQVLGVQRVHNDVLELAVDLGALGLLCLAAIIITFCRQLYLLFLHASGKHRILYALLVIAVTASMLEAQLAFPYEMPFPLVIMPLFMALVIRGGENVMPADVKKVDVGRWFNRSAIGGLAAMLALLTLINGQWLWDFKRMNRVLEDLSANLDWKPASWLYSQAHITGTRAAVDALSGAGMHAQALRIMKPMVEYWPNTVASTQSMARANMGMGRLEEAEHWALKSIEVQPKGSYMGEVYLFNIYAAQGEMGKLTALYNSMKEQPEELLLMYSDTLSALHYNSILLNDFGNTDRFYSLFVQNHEEVAGVEANHAVYLVSLNEMPEALHHMQRALALDARIPQAEGFRDVLAQNGLL